MGFRTAQKSGKTHALFPALDARPFGAQGDYRVDRLESQSLVHAAQLFAIIYVGRWARLQPGPILEYDELSLCRSIAALSAVGHYEPALILVGCPVNVSKRLLLVGRESGVQAEQEHVGRDTIQ